jgi:hypothetical protein
LKEYTIWLKSGKSISGTVEDDVADIIVLDSKMFSKLRFSDSEGVVSVNRRRIEALAINNIPETRKCGF